MVRHGDAYTTQVYTSALTRLKRNCERVFDPHCETDTPHQVELEEVAKSSSPVERGEHSQRARVNV